MVRSQDEFIFKNMPKFDMRKSDPEIQNQIKSFWVSRSTADLVQLDNTDGLRVVQTETNFFIQCRKRSDPTLKDSEFQ